MPKIINVTKISELKYMCFIILELSVFSCTKICIAMVTDITNLTIFGVFHALYTSTAVSIKDLFVFSKDGGGGWMIIP